MDNLQPPQETTIQSDEFRLRYQSMVLQFTIAKRMLLNGKELSIKCLAVIEQFPFLNREKVREIYILSTDDVANQKLVNFKSSGKDQIFYNTIQIVNIQNICNNFPIYNVETNEFIRKYFVYTYKIANNC